MTTRARSAAKLSREAIVNAALTFLDREGWDALTINALAIQLGTKGPSLYNHVDSLDDLRRTVRTLLAAMGCPDAVAEAILAHKPPGVMGVYNLHTYDAEKRHWLAALDVKLEQLASA